MESRKQAVSIRMSASDVRKIKRLADRLGARDSDIIRYAVKSMLARLGALHDPMIRGRNLVPVFLDCEPDLFRQFDLDAARLEAILNEGAEAGSEVSHQDVQLIAMAGSNRGHLRWTLGVAPPPAGMARTAVAAAAPSGEVRPSAEHHTNGHDNDEDEGEGAPLAVRGYLFQKYVYGDGGSR